MASCLVSESTSSTAGGASQPRACASAIMRSSFAPTSSRVSRWMARRSARRVSLHAGWMRSPLANESTAAGASPAPICAVPRRNHALCHCGSRSQARSASAAAAACLPTLDKARARLLSSRALLFPPGCRFKHSVYLIRMRAPLARSNSGERGAGRRTSAPLLRSCPGAQPRRPESSGAPPSWT